MEGFTKGAWRADDTGRGDFSIVALREGYVVELGHIDDQHDATLIAAAPELLEALTRLEAWASTMHGYGVAYSGDHPIAKAKAAITKALGQ